MVKSKGVKVTGKHIFYRPDASDYEAKFISLKKITDYAIY